jgi:hypothetical protein
LRRGYVWRLEDQQINKKKTQQKCIGISNIYRRFDHRIYYLWSL